VGAAAIALLAGTVCPCHAGHAQQRCDPETHQGSFEHRTLLLSHHRIKGGNQQSRFYSYLRSIQIPATDEKPEKRKMTKTREWH
jgi:hypothetical protein